MEFNDIRIFREAMHQLQRNLGWQWKCDAACCGITIAQCYALLEVGKNGVITLVDLASNLGLDTSTLSRTINGMVQAGLVERKANSEDRRFINITLAEQGKKIYDRINHNLDHYYTEIFTEIPPHKHRQVMESITMLANAINSLNNGNCCREEFQSE